MNQDDVIIKIQIDSNLSVEAKQKIYMDVINGLNDRYLPVLSIMNNDVEVFNNQTGFTEGRFRWEK